MVVPRLRGGGELGSQCSWMESFSLDCEEVLVKGMEVTVAEHCECTQSTELCTDHGFTFNHAHTHHVQEKACASAPSFFLWLECRPLGWRLSSHLGL